MESHPRASAKDFKVAFVSNLPGTTLLDIHNVATCITLLGALRGLILLLSGRTRLSLLTCQLDFLLMCLPVVAFHTSLASHLVPANLLLAAALPALLFLATRVVDLRTLPHQSHRPSLRTVLSNFRGCSLLSTGICILGIDFPIFPRRFGKVEHYGHGLMDAGTGLFVYINAICSKEATAWMNGQAYQLRVGFSTMFRSLLPIVLLGLARLVAVKTTDYAEHVSEYGVHWNFFLTLAVLKVMYAVMGSLIRMSPARSLLAGLAVAVAHQAALSFGGLNSAILHGFRGDNSRIGFLDANREGVISLTGYLALYLISAAIPHALCSRNLLHSLGRLVVVNAVSWVLFWLSEAFVEPVCRRSANLTFILWQTSSCTSSLLLFLIIDVVVVSVLTPAQSHEVDNERPSSPPELQIHRQPLIFWAADANPLPYFLASNLLTGLINMTVDTLSCPNPAAFLLLVVYQAVLYVVFVTLKVCNIRLKV